MVTGAGTRLGLETAAPCQPRAALAGEGSESRWNLQISKVPALHREAERDTTGSISRQPPVHTWIGPLVQGKRRSMATLDLIRHSCVKLRLTLWSYCGKEGCSEARIRWRAAQIIVFCWDARYCALQHCLVLTPQLSVRRRGSRRARPQRRIFPSPRMPPSPAPASKPASSSTSTKPSHCTPFRWPILIRWWSPSPTPAFNCLRGLAAPDAG